MKVEHRIRDVQHRSAWDRDITFPPGWSRATWQLHRSEAIDLKQVAELSFSMVEPQQYFVLYFDNAHLARQQTVQLEVLTQRLGAIAQTVAELTEKLGAVGLSLDEEVNALLKRGRGLSERLAAADTADYEAVHGELNALEADAQDELAEVLIARELFAQILERIWDLAAGAGWP